MEAILQFISAHSQQAHWLFFSLLMFAGLNLPISEDLVLIASGVLAAAVKDVNPVNLFIFVFMGCYLSDWMAYWIGRLLEPRLRNRKWFSRMFNQKRIDQIQAFYQKYGLYTLFVGRFIPFGVRNCLFMAAGIGRMPFLKFIVSDGCACLISNFTLFYLAYSFEQHYRDLIHYVKAFNIIIFAIFAVLAVILIWYKLKSRKKTRN